VTPAQGVPQFAEWTRIADPGNVIAATGVAFSTFSGSDLGKDAQILVSDGGAPAPAEIIRLTSDKVAFVIPQQFARDMMYLVWPRNGSGIGRPVAVNGTEARWAGPNICSPGDTISVYGKNLARYGSTYTGANQSYVYLKQAGAWAQVVSANPYKVDFIVPSSAANGPEQLWVHNGRGGKYGWSGPVSLTIRSRYAWSATEINVKDHGAKGDGVADDYDAITKAIAAASGKKATVYFPSGTYMTSATLAFGGDLRVRGDGKTLSTIKKRMAAAAVALGSNAEAFNIGFDENSASKTPYDRLLSIGSHVTLRNVLLDDRHASAFDISGCEYVRFIDCEIVLAGQFCGACSQILFKNCDFRFTADAEEAFNVWAGNGISVTNCRFRDYDNTQSWGWGEGRVFVTQPHWAPTRDVYIGNNTSSDLTPRPEADQNSGEQILFEQGIYVYRGQVASPTATTFRVASLTGNVAGKVAVVTAGRGLGQVRDISAHDTISGVITVTPPFNVVPDNSSTIFIGHYTCRAVIFGNALDGKDRAAAAEAWTACRGIAPWGGAMDIVGDANVFTDLRAGIGMDAFNNNGDDESCFWGTYRNNRFESCRMGIYVNGMTKNVVGNLGQVFTNNIITDKKGVAQNAIDAGTMREQTFDDLLVFDGNAVSNIARPVNTASGDVVKNLLLRRNQFDRGTAPAAGSRALANLPPHGGLYGNTYTGFDSVYSGTLPGAILEAPQRLIEIDVPQGGAGTAKLVIWNAGTSSLRWTSSSDAPWLTQSAASGEVTGERDADTVTLSCTEAAVGTGKSGTITITAGSQTVKIGVLAQKGQGAAISRSPTRIAVKNEPRDIYDLGGRLLVKGSEGRPTGIRPSDRHLPHPAGLRIEVDTRTGECKGKTVIMRR